jgi:hypothetical protein
MIMDRIDYKNLPSPLAWRLFEMDCVNAEPGVSATALLYGIERGWARGDEDGDWHDLVWTGEENATEILNCRAAFVSLMGCRPADEAEAIVVFTALNAVPAAWRNRADEQIELLSWEWPAVREAWIRILIEAEKKMRSG